MFVPVESRLTDLCADCGTAIRRGDLIGWNPRTKQVVCEDCLCNRKNLADLRRDLRKMGAAKLKAEATDYALRPVAEQKPDVLKAYQAELATRGLVL